MSAEGGTPQKNLEVLPQGEQPARTAGSRYGFAIPERDRRYVSEGARALSEHLIERGTRPLSAEAMARVEAALTMRTIVMAHDCDECGEKVFDYDQRRRRRTDARYCSGACRQRAYRRRERDRKALDGAS
jgi:hypothetical protein